MIVISIMCRVILSEYYFKDHIGNKCTLVCFNVSSLVRLHACSLLVSCICVILLNKFNSIQFKVLTLAAPVAQHSFPPCYSIFMQSVSRFLPRIPCPFLDVINVLHHRTPPSSFPRHHSENASLYKITIIVLHACPKKAIFLLIIWARSSRLV